MIKILLVASVLFVQSGLTFVSFPFEGKWFLENFMKIVVADPQDIASDFKTNAVPGSKCNRQCSTNDRRVCHFKFRLEFYEVLGSMCHNCSKKSSTFCSDAQCVTADGIERGLLTVNRQLPGTSIQVCVDDIVVVDVTNYMDGTSTTIHWHGMTMKGTPFSDGVPFITQCPAQFGNTFRYSFEAKDAGTHFYHSHSGLQRANGLFGSIIVRIPQESKLYDHDPQDFTVLISDWMHSYAEQFFPKLPDKQTLFSSLLINGRGVHYEESTKTYSDAPLTVYNVNPKQRYRFRLINAASNVCSFILKIENHNLTVIASDGSSIEPTVVEQIHFTSGERYDFIVETNQEPRDYSIQMKGFASCKISAGYAVLRYGNKAHPETSLDFMDMDKLIKAEPIMNEKTFNQPNVNTTWFPISISRGMLVDYSVIHSKPDKSFNLFFGTPKVIEPALFNSSNIVKYMSVLSDTNNATLNNIGIVNNITFAMPNFALMTEPEKINEELFCDSNKRQPETCLPDTIYCRCLHRLKVNLGEIVEFVLIDIGDAKTHPFHLHGTKFYVMEMGSLDSSFTTQKIKDEGIPVANLNPKPVHKDTVLIPNKGFVRLRFRADNPGFWLAHCHFEWHLAIGMSFILQVGEVNEMPRPPEKFAKCNNFMPNHMV